MPCEGTVLSDAERNFIELWTSKVAPYIHSIESAATEALKDGYEGERNEAGEYDGEGSFRYLESGDYYEGQVFLRQTNQSILPYKWSRHFIWTTRFHFFKS